MCFQITTHYFCGHEVLTTTVYHNHREDYAGGIETRYCDDFIDNAMKEDFVCDECREEQEVKLTKDRKIPRMAREEEKQEEEEEQEKEDGDEYWEEWEEEDMMTDLEEIDEDQDSYEVKPNTRRIERSIELAE
ncbi:hypothetical protein DL98DRAFT_598796 [Cadophora sp. DSE1049]|nr:hypothetical protein DL98DRAFT_598796 [Cadophora sp. DSE1049]